LEGLGACKFPILGAVDDALYITLETALFAGLDHSENQWKALFARPVPRWTVYVSKLLIAAAMMAASGAVLVCGLIAAGLVLRHLTSEARFDATIPFAPILQQTAQMTGLAFLSLTVQHWVSLRWRSFSVAIGFGIVMMVTSFAMLLASGQYGTWPQYFPWALPMLVLAKQPHNVGAALLIGAAVGVVCTVAGCLDFCSREVT
jgi:lantibiotic transport system permease protein